MGDEELTPANFIERIKNMDNRARGKLQAKQLIDLILQTNVHVAGETDVQLQELRASIDFVTKMAATNQGEIITLKTENARLNASNVEYRDEIDDLRRQMNDRDGDNPSERITTELKNIRDQINEIEQYLRVNNLEIVGLPKPNQGETEEMVLIEAFNELEGIDITVTAEDIDISHPLNTRRQDGKPVHVVRFVSRKTKEAILTAKKSEANRQYKFRTKDVFINEHLSKQNRSLFAAAQEKKRTLNYKYCWTRGGNIKLRKADDSEVINITSEEQLAAIVV